MMRIQLLFCYVHYLLYLSILLILCYIVGYYFYGRRKGFVKLERVKKKKMSETWNGNHMDGLVARGRSKKKNLDSSLGNNKGISKSKGKESK